jgi:glycosyltransferase involved in cell wall biosynthesis
LERLVGDATLRQRMGRAGRRRVEERYSLQSRVAELASIFVRLSSRKAG